MSPGAASAVITGLVGPRSLASAPLAAGPTAWRAISRNGYTFKIDAAGRTRHVSGSLVLATNPTRSRSEQLRAGGAERRRTDDGGHYVAARFNGPTEAFNHFAQDANFNRGGYAAMERAWAADVRRGKHVVVKITPFYDGMSKRPSSIGIVFEKNGHEETRLFQNDKQEARHGK